MGPVELHGEAIRTWGLPSGEGSDHLQDLRWGNRPHQGLPLHIREPTECQRVQPGRKVTRLEIRGQHRGVEGAAVLAKDIQYVWQGGDRFTRGGHYVGYHRQGLVVLCQHCQEATIAVTLLKETLFVSVIVIRFLIKIKRCTLSLFVIAFSL